MDNNIEYPKPESLLEDASSRYLDQLGSDERKYTYPMNGLPPLSDRAPD